MKKVGSGHVYSGDMHHVGLLRDSTGNKFIYIPLVAVRTNTTTTTMHINELQNKSEEPSFQN